MVEIGGCASRGTMPQFTTPPSVTRERMSWNPTEADGPRTKPERRGTPTIDGYGLPAGLGSFRRVRTSIESFFLDLQLDARTSPKLVSSLNLR